MAADVGERRIWRLVVTLDRSQLQLVRGVRNAVGVVALLIVGILTDNIKAGVLMAGGALLVGFIDLGASYASRARVMLIATVLVGVSTLVGTLAGGIDWLTVVLMAVWGFAAGLSVCLGMAPAFLGVNAALGLLLSAYFPGGLSEGLERAGLTVLGGLVQTALALAIWPLRPFRPERIAVASAYRAVAVFVNAMAAGASTDTELPKLQAALAKARALLDDSEGRSVSSTPAGEAFRTLMLEADRAYPEVIALVHIHPQLPAPAGAALGDALAATSEALRAIAGELTGGPACDELVEQLRDRMRSATRTIESTGDGHRAGARLEALRAQLRAAVDAATGWTRGRETGSRLRRAIPRRRALGAHNALSVVHANLSLQSTAFRHGVRLGATLAVATALYRLLDLPRGYWVPLTVAFVLKPDFGGTFSRGLQRYAGTIIGSVVASAITAMLDPGHWTLVVLVGIFAAGIYTFIFANYLLFTTSVTALIVFFVAFDGVSEWTAVTDRLLDTIIGGALTLAAYWLWPTWEGERVSGRLADLIDAHRRYAAAVLDACIDPARYDGDALHNARLSGRRARTEAEASVEVAQAEPRKHRGNIDTDLDVLASLRRLADSTLALEAILEDAPARTARPALRPLAHDLDDALAELAAVERDGGALRLPALRDEHDALARAEGADSTVAQETDLMVNAVDTLGHLLMRDGPSAPAVQTAGVRS
jgi:uncharacterized membrane protein YccC